MAPSASPSPGRANRTALPPRGALGVKGRRVRAVAALAILAGFDLLHTVLGVEVLDDPEGRRLLVKLLQLVSTSDYIPGMVLVIGKSVFVFGARY
jgi:hypothetical protein